MNGAVNDRWHVGWGQGLLSRLPRHHDRCTPHSCRPAATPMSAAAGHFRTHDPQNKNPASNAKRAWVTSEPLEPKARPGVVWLAATYENSARVKNLWYWYVGVTVNDHAALPGPYSRLGAPSAVVPVEVMYSMRNGKLKPAKLRLPSLAAGSKL